MHESVNYGMEEGMSRLCDAAVVRSTQRGGGARQPHGAQTVPSYFLPVPKMGTTSRRDGVIAKCEKSRAGKTRRGRVSIFSPLKFVSPRRFLGDVGRVGGGGGWEKKTTWS